MAVHILELYLGLKESAGLMSTIWRGSCEVVDVGVRNDASRDQALRVLDIHFVLYVV